MTYSDVIGKRVREIRDARGVSAQALADKTGLSREVIANLETGRKAHVTVEELVRLAQGLNVGLAYLLTDPADPYGPLAAFPEEGLKNLEVFGWLWGQAPGLGDSDRVLFVARMLRSHRENASQESSHIASWIEQENEESARRRAEFSHALNQEQVSMYVEELRQLGVEVPEEEQSLPSVDEQMLLAKRELLERRARKLSPSLQGT